MRMYQSIHMVRYAKEVIARHWWLVGVVRVSALGVDE